MGNLILLFIVNASLIIVTTRVQASLPQSEYGPKIQALQENVHTACVSKSGTDEVSISNVIKGVFTDEPKIKLYMTCVLQETKVIDEGGIFHGEIIAQLLPDNHKEDGLTAIKGCITKTNDITNLEDKIFAFFKCYYEENSDVFIFF